ncbi:hypothetical protein ACFFU1_16735 [Algibacter miyuki]|uniref:Uncharacterized protein n=1 Tax=Algibacter miyuki TaxID=1306933 RepID=A0ABV5H3S2_9FLAO|nr:hypothetical protein [Algibacter miyuki]MDN3665626.1 hypothetical protein [Algibacter miyuki]
MTLTAIKKNKNNSFLPSEQVKTILQEKGMLKVFNYSDYEYFKSQVKKEFNKSYAIAELFISENLGVNESDLNEYIF